ncbi:isoleucine-tRNA ligase [Batrachochytrium salamandrivorans]|nr:isoleucine-tRNA ligase [Batrachochytrium salamandrivorans]
MKPKTVFASLHLPKTGFGLRPNNERFKQSTVLDRITTNAYRNQLCSSSSFYLLDGPPFANGQLHMGHFLNKVLKDMFNRFQLGFNNKRICYLPGWDCHGLPIELLVKKSAASSLGEIRTKSRAIASKAVNAQAEDFKSWGVLADWDTRYTTMDKEFEAKEMVLFQQLFSKGLISRRLKPVYWSPKSQTALAEAELEYKDNHESSSVFAKFKVVNSSNLSNAFLVAWTTTPWSLTANMALAINQLAAYSQIRLTGTKEVLIVATDCIDRLVQQSGLPLESSQSIPMQHLLELECESPQTKRLVKILSSDHVTMDSGTGIVHIAPLHGLEDFDCFTKAFPESLTFSEKDLTIDRRGRFKSHVFEDCPDAMTVGNQRICEQLERDHLLVGKIKPIKHRYPIDWRTKTPIMIMATNQFFLQLLPEQAQEMCQRKIQFIPESGRNRLMNTIGLRKEWCLSRQRVWGLPIPYYQHKTNDNEVYITESLIANFAKQCQQRGSDFWFEDAKEEDDLQLLPKAEVDKQCWKRGRDTLDVWFDSGSVWESSNPFGKVPDLVVEGSDQHRGWFQSSVLLKCATTNSSPPFQAIVTHGFVLDDKKQKMSKSLGNVISPQEAIHQFNGNVDVLRLWVAGADITGDVLMSKESLDRAADKMKKIRHLWRFFISLGPPLKIVELDALDKALLHVLGETRNQYVTEMNLYQARLGINAVMEFLHGETLKAYIEGRKDALYCNQLLDDKRQATLYVLRQVLEHTLAMLSPVCVFMVDEIMHEHGIQPSHHVLSKYEFEAQAFTRLLRLRGELNQLNLPDDVRAKTNLVVTVTDHEGKLLLDQFTTCSLESQWSNAAEVLQVCSLVVKLGSRFQMDCIPNPSANKCLRCRKPHPSTTSMSNELCNRCITSEQAL